MAALKEKGIEFQSEEYDPLLYPNGERNAIFRGPDDERLQIEQILYRTNLIMKKGPLCMTVCAEGLFVCDAEPIWTKNFFMIKIKNVSNGEANA